MISLLYLSLSAAAICVVVTILLKYISISKTKLDGGKDQKITMPTSTLEVLTLLKTLKPFPISVNKGWKLHSHQSSGRVWMHDIGGSRTAANTGVFAAFRKVKVPPQVVNQLLKDVTKTSSWKPGCLATSITFQAPEYDGGSRFRGMMGNYPVQHDIVIEETSPVVEDKEGGIFQYLVKSVLELQSSSPNNITNEFKRYWHREDNGVCWHLQMCEEYQQWLFFLSQPVEEVDRCLLSILGYQGNSYPHSGAHFVSTMMGSFTEYIQYRRLPMTPLIDIKLPASKSGRLQHSYSSSDDAVHSPSHGNRMLLRFRSLVERPALEAEKFLSLKRKLARSASILHHMSSAPDKKDQRKKEKQLKTSSLDRKDMPHLRPGKQEDVKGVGDSDLEEKKSGESDTQSKSSVDVEVTENNNLKKSDCMTPDEDDKSVTADGDNGGKVVSDPSADHLSALEKDIDKILEEDVNDQEKYEKIGDVLLNTADAKVDIHHIVMANHAAAELLAVALQASNIDLSKSIEEQVMRSGGWMFCGLENDVVVLKKISLKENIQCFLGKGVIQAAPLNVFNAVKNPRTRFTYDDTLKKVDVLENVSDTIKVVYYYHEMLQLFKTESFDMTLIQNERADRGDKYVLALQSIDKPELALPEGTLRVKVLPSGWIIEPIQKDKKLVSMVTYIMQVDFGDPKRGLDRTPYEELIAKQPMCIAFLRQYLRGYSHLK